MNLFTSLLSRLKAKPANDCETIMVLGMHRSGTSFLTGSLQQAGLELGKHSAWNPHNRKGNRENQDIVAFHDRLLSSRGFAWDNPPSTELTWTPDEVAEAKRLIADYAGVRRWGFKDPRTLLALSGWQSLLPELRFIGIFRHPKAVAASLAARGSMTEEKAFHLWETYNRKLLELHKRQPFPLLCFDEDEETVHHKLNSVLPEFGLQPLDDERFFSAELKHHEMSDQPLNSTLAELYKSLQQRSL